MATILDATLFGYFNSLFVFLFVLVVSYAVMSSTKFLGDNSAINAIVAFIMAAIFASSNYVVRIFAYAVPWYVLLFIVVSLIELFTKFTGAEEVFALKKNTAIVTIVLILVVVIFAISAGQVSKENKQQAEKDGVSPILTLPQKIGETLRHPAVLGLIIVMLMATFSVMMLSSKSH